MKKLKLALAAFWQVLSADEYCIIAIKGKRYYHNVDMKLMNFKYFGDQLIDDTIGGANALNAAQQILKDAE